MSHHSDHQPFKIKAWPFVDHESTANSSRTWILWPFIYHSRDMDGTVTFKINPLLLSIHKRQDHHLTIGLLFYSFYLNIVWHQFTTFFFLPLLMFIKVRQDRVWRRIVLLGGLLFYGLFEQQHRKLIIPPLLFYSRTNHHHNLGNKSWLHVIFPLVWSYGRSSGVTAATAHTEQLLFVLPLFWKFSNQKFDILHVWPLFGRQDRKDHYRYRDYSFFYPLFRVRVGENQSEFTVHFLWPLAKYSKKLEKKSFRFFPFVWIRHGATHGRGNIFLVYWSWQKDKVFRFGVFPFFHVGWDLTQHKEHFILVPLLFAWYDNSYVRVRCYTWLHCSITEKQKKETKHWIFPLFYRKTEGDDFKLTIIPLLLLYLKQDKDEFLLVQIPFVVRNFRGSGTDTYRHLWILGYYGYSENSTIAKKTMHLILPLLTFYYNSDSGANDRERHLYITPLLGYTTRVFLATNFKSIYLFPLFIFRHEKGENYEWQRLWITPLFRSAYTYNNYSRTKTVFLLPLFFVRREMSNQQKLIDLKVLTLVILVWKWENAVLWCSPLFGLYRHSQGWSLWLLPIIFIRKDAGTEDLYVVLPIFVSGYMSVDKNHTSLLVLPFGSGIFSVKDTHLPAYARKTTVILYGLFVQSKNSNRNIKFLFPCYLDYEKYEFANYRYTIICPFLLPPYFFRFQYNKETKTIALLPFFLWGMESGSLFVFPPLMRFSLANSKERIITIFPIFRYAAHKETGETDIRLLFFFDLALAKYRRQFTKGGTVHMENVSFYCYPLIFWSKQYLLLSKRSKQLSREFNRADYYASDPQTTFTLLGFLTGYGLFSATIDTQFHAIQIYVFPLFHIESEAGVLFTDTYDPRRNQSHRSHRLWSKNNPNDDTFSLSFLWLFHPRLCLMSYTSRTNNSFYRTDEAIFYITFLFYIKTTNHFGENSYNNTKTISLLWIIPKVPLIYRYSYYEDGACYQSLNYIFPFVFLQLFDEMSKNGMTKSFDFSLFWFIHKNVALFFYNSDKFYPAVTASEVNDAEALEMEDVRTSEQKRLSIHIPTTFEDKPLHTHYWSYIPILYYFDRDEKTSLTKFSMFWFFLRQVSFIRYSKETGKEVKLVLFPLYKYGRRSGEWSKWCLFPFVPIKYSYQACVLVREKVVRQRGAVLDRAAEDKSQRQEDIDIRFLYRVIRYQTKDGNTTFEWNPFYNSEKNRQTEYASWDCIGGCVGQRKMRNRDKECRCCCFFYF